MTKIDIISGFLGAGKTTLIKKLLSEAFQNEKVVLIENEFGEIGIDGGFLKDAGVEIVEIDTTELKEATKVVYTQEVFPNLSPDIYEKLQAELEKIRAAA